MVDSICILSQALSDVNQEICVEGINEAFSGQSMQLRSFVYKSKSVPDHQICECVRDFIAEIP